MLAAASKMGCCCTGIRAGLDIEMIAKEIQRAAHINEKQKTILHSILAISTNNGIKLDVNVSVNQFD